MAFPARGDLTLTAPDAFSPQVLQWHPARLGSATLRLMIARSSVEKAKGLMFRPSLNPDEGMLFCYSQPQPMVFWMKNTLIPLDVIFFDRTLTICDKIEGMKPGNGLPDHLLPRYPCKTDAQYALELPVGSIKRLEIRHGMTLEISLPLLFTVDP